MSPHREWAQTRRDLAAATSPDGSLDVLRRALAGSPDRAHELIPTLTERFGRATARTLWTQAGARPIERAGLAVVPLEEAAGGLRPAVATDEAHAALPTGAGWALVHSTPRAWEPSTMVNADHVAWLGTSPVLARGNEISAATRLTDGTWHTRHVWTASSPIDGLLGLGDGSLAVEVRRLLGRDLFVIDGAGGEPAGPLPTLSPSLLRSVAMPGGGLACIGDGVQRTEVRFVWSGGRWLARTRHETSVVALAPTPTGCVSLDRDGNILAWTGGERPRVSGSAQSNGPLPHGQSGVCALVEGARGLVVLVHAGSQLWRVDDAGKNQSLAEDVGRLADRTLLAPDGTRCGLVAFADGWYRIDPRTGGLPACDRLPLALATDAERRAVRRCAGSEGAFEGRVLR